MKKKVKYRRAHPHLIEVSGILKIIIYIITYLLWSLLAVVILTGPNYRYDVIIKLLLSVIIFWFGYYEAFRHQDCWQMLHFRYNALVRRPVRYFDCVTPKMKKEDQINGIILMVMYGLCLIYSVLRLIFFCQ